MTEIIANILLIIEDFKFRKKIKARRKYEKENNLPKKIMIHPTLKILGLGIILFFFAKLIINYFYTSSIGENRTTTKINEIENILESGNNDLGYYPQELNEIIRNNPLRQNITTDFWGNEFYYKVIENGQNYILISKGKDGILKTVDDIESEQNLHNKD